MVPAAAVEHHDIPRRSPSGLTPDAPGKGTQEGTLRTGWPEWWADAHAAQAVGNEQATVALMRAGVLQVVLHPWIDRSDLIGKIGGIDGLAIKAEGDVEPRSQITPLPGIVRLVSVLSTACSKTPEIR